MATRRQTSNSSIVGKINDIDRSVRILAAKPVPTRIADQAITTTTIADKAIDESKVKDFAIGRTKMVNLSVSTEKIEYGAVTSDRLANDAVGPAALADDAVGPAALADDAVGPAALADNAVTASALAPGSVTAAAIGAGEVTSTALANGAVTFGKLGAASVESSNLRTGSVTGSIIADYGIGANKLGLSAVSLSVLAEDIRARIQDWYDSESIEIVELGDGARGISAIFGTTSTTVAVGNHTHAGGGSTAKVKKNISDYEIDNLDLLFDLSPKRFQYIDPERGEAAHRVWNYGYIAEEVLDLGLEQIVGYNHHGEPETLNYALLSVWVLELVKRQQKEIDSLKQQLAEIKAHIGLDAAD